MQGKILLKQARYRRHVQPIAPLETPIQVTGDWLCNELAEAIIKITESLQLGDIAGHFLVSTSIDVPFSGGLLNWEAMRRHIGAKTEFVPDTMVNAYECASWGYTLRYISKLPRRAPYVLLHVVDANLLNLEMWHENENWGKSGFGIASLLFELQGDSFDDLIVINASKTGQRVAEFTMDVRKEAHKRPGVPLALPFFPKNITDVLDRSLAGIPRLDDLHAQFGHCFGCDPWLGIINDVATGNVGPRRYLAASIALVGYWAMAEVETCANGIYCFEEQAA